MTFMPSTSKTQRPSLANHLRLVGALAAKDIMDALKTKTTLTILVISLLMVLFYRYFPLLVSDNQTLNVLLYAETETAVTEALGRSPALAVYSFPTRERLMAAFAGAEEVELAVMLPETAVAPPPDDGPLTVDGYLMYWVSPAQRTAVKALVETELSAQLDQPVTLNLADHDVYFNADTFFFVFGATIALLFITIMIGILLVPNLMVEEKQTKTLDALLVSPASTWHLVAGKAIAGLFYGLLGSSVVLLVFHYLILQWPLAILAALLATLLMVALGLLLGSIVQVRAQLQLIASLVAVPLLIPVILVALEGLVPARAIAVMNWIPTVLVAQIFRLSFTPNAAFTHYGAALVVTLAATLVLLALVVWVLRRQDSA